ncbi:MucR family transcriptional regulator [Labrys portucalensis]|uniref:MucR family transcriptional regulator n=1 Tax=Labrys neptuniae TaxID=376174 RepID=A0ABV6ZSA0_9HYPH
MHEAQTNSETDLVGLTADLVSAYIANNRVPTSFLADLILAVHTSLYQLTQPPPAKAARRPIPAVPIRESVTPEYIICLEDGRQLKSLKRHLRTLGLSPVDYRQKWGLPENYPMAAPNYAAKRSDLAKQMGLGAMRHKSKTSPSTHRE